MYAGYLNACISLLSKMTCNFTKVHVEAFNKIFIDVHYQKLTKIQLKLPFHEKYAILLSQFLMRKKQHTTLRKSNIYFQVTCISVRKFRFNEYSVIYNCSCCNWGVSNCLINIEFLRGRLSWFHWYYPRYLKLFEVHNFL